MRDQDVAIALLRIAQRDVSGSVDLWPAIARQVGRRQALRWSPAQVAVAGALALALMAGSLGLARHFIAARPAAPAQVPPQGPVSYVLAEAYPDLASLAAASDLVVRGRAAGTGRLQVDEVILGRLQQSPDQVDVAQPELPSGMERPPQEPPLQPGGEYILFLALRYPYAAGAADAPGGLSFRPVGGAQGEWLIRDGSVVQEADTPLARHDGEPAARFVEAIASAPDLRATAAALLRDYGWSPAEPLPVTGLAAPSGDDIARDADVKAWLEASQRVGLDWAPYAGRPVLYLMYELQPQGIMATVLVADGQPIGAWLLAGEEGLILGIDQRGEALQAS